jgi:hypothetical protein
MPELQLGNIERETLSPESARRWLGERSRVRQSLPQALTLHDRERGVPCRRRYGRDIPIFNCYLQAQAGALRAACVRKALTGGAVRGDTVHSSVTPDNHVSESEAKFAAERSSGTVGFLLMSFFIADHRPRESFPFATGVIFSDGAS